MVTVTGAEFRNLLGKVKDEQVVPAFIEARASYILDFVRKLIVDSRQVGKKHGSPVWSGRYSASHNVSVNRFDRSVRPRHPKADETPWTPTGKEPRPRVKRRQSLANVGQLLRKARFRDRIFVTNALDYAVDLERNAKSKKAPRGAYRPTLAFTNKRWAARPTRVRRTK